MDFEPFPYQRFQNGIFNYRTVIDREISTYNSTRNSRSEHMDKQSRIIDVNLEYIPICFDHEWFRYCLNIVV